MNEWRRRAFVPKRGRAIIATVVALASFLILQVVLFGYGATRGGGQLGRFLDNAVRRTMFERAVIRHEQRFLQFMGYPLPALPEQGANKVGVHVLLNSWLAETLMRTKKRRDSVDLHLKLSSTESKCPFHIIQPNVVDWYRPIEWELNLSLNNTSRTRALIFDDEQIVEFMMEHFEQLYTTFYQRASIAERVQIFGFAAVYVFGGIFVSSDIRDSDTLSRVAPGILLWIEKSATDCKPVMWFQSKNRERINVVAATPNHPVIMCVLTELLADHGAEWRSVFHLMEHTKWDPSCKPRCCPLQNLLEQSMDVFSTKDVSALSDEAPRFQVTITEKGGTEIPNLKPKDRRSDRLRRQWCSAGWLCHRCLRMPFAGSLKACRLVCRSCYQNNVCITRKLDEVVVQVSVKENPNSNEKRIPRIIHQTWFDELSAARYPHFQRLQNSWKASGWDYRFYKDEDCVLYVQQNYPRRFVDAYDAVLPGAFKADLFRLLVLFKDGGVYSDIDVQLDVDLDMFITNDLSFFVPRDVPLDYWPNSNYCLWNGLLGAAPGHPIVAKAIEDVVTTILNRDDYYDVEGSLCSRNLDMHLWKLRTLPILILTGPCALGISVNAALGIDDRLAGHDLGWLRTANVSAHHEPPDHYWGDALTLLGDRFDLGELRFTDIDRNLMVASTNQDRITGSAINYGLETPKKSPVHYSKSETDIVGEFGTYKDDLVLNEQVRLRITHEYV